AAVTENIRARSATWAEKIAHIFDDTEHRHVHAIEHGNAAPGVDQREVLWCRDDDRALEWHLLRNRQLRISGSGRHIDDHDVQLAPFNLAQHLRDRRHDHRATPYHGRFLID